MLETNEYLAYPCLSKDQDCLDYQEFLITPIRKLPTSGSGQNQQKELQDLAFPSVN